MKIKCIVVCNYVNVDIIYYFSMFLIGSSYVLEILLIMTAFYVFTQNYIDKVCTSQCNDTVYISKVGHTTIMAASACTSCSITSVTCPTTTYSSTPAECSYSIASAVSFSTDI